MTRRKLLQLLVGSLGALGVGSVARTGEKLIGSDGNDLLGGRLSDILAHRESASAVGREYLKVAPLEANVRRLIDLIGSPEKCDRSDTDREAFRGWLQAKQRQDFELGRVVLVQGWMLSQTEARICALVALT